MSKNALVSVIIPTYNRRPYLERALKSVLRQGHGNLEVIVVDDHSTDDTPTFIEGFCKRDQRIIFLRSDENRGNGFSRHWGLGMAKGSFISFLDDDDEWLEKKIEFQLEKALEIDTPALILCNGYDQERAQPFAMDLKFPEGRIIFKHKELPLRYALPNPSHWFFSRALFEKVGNFDKNLRCWVDADYLLRIYLNNIPIYYFNRPLVRRCRIENQGHVSRVGAGWLHGKEQFLRKHAIALSKDRHFLFRLYYSIGKDFVRIGQKMKARRYFLRALALRPCKAEILLKLLKTLPPSENVRTWTREARDKFADGFFVVRLKIRSFNYWVAGMIFYAQERLSGYRKERRGFQRACGYEPNLRTPQSYNEKIVWKKLYDRNPMLPVVADKYRVRQYLAEVLGEPAAREILVPLLYVTARPETIPFDSLPEEYIIKPNHGSGMHIVIEKGQVDRQKVVALCREWLHRPYGLKMHEWAYQKIRRKILVEKLLRGDGGHPLVNYKFVVFHGKCHLIQAVNGRAPEERIGYFSPGWDPLPISGALSDIGFLERPEMLDDMIRLAETLAAPFDAIRVDLYSVKGKIYFSEFTNYDASGRSRWVPRSYDYEFGSRWNIVPGYWRQKSF